MPSIQTRKDRFEGDNGRNSLDRWSHPRPVELYGHGSNDFLWGSQFDDYLDGGEGADYMSGNKGNDVYIVDNVNDFIRETPGDGSSRSGTYDIVFSTVNYTLPDNVELLVLEGNAIRGTGNSSLSTIFGNSRNNILRTGGGDGSWISGLDGNDQITGSGAREGLSGDNGDDIIYGFGGDDKLYGGNDNDRLYGGKGNDFLTGQSGNDLLVGADGHNSEAEIDTYKGGSGRDTFALTAKRGYYRPINILAYNSFGSSDYAEIQDFNLNEDRLQLAPGHSYGVANARRWGHSGTAITAGPGEELIAVLENISDPSAIEPSRHFHVTSF